MPAYLHRLLHKPRKTGRHGVTVELVRLALLQDRVAWVLGLQFLCTLCHSYFPKRFLVLLQALLHSGLIHSTPQPASQP